MNELVFVGLGLHDEKGLSLHGLDEIKTADEAFIELYTSLLPGFSQERLEKLSGKRIQVLSRKEIEEENGRLVLEAA
ncbi:diphthine synthase, partial [Candidatus Bathyarchaeota archaeon]|nr:diphthine synthase [Candidatus Bathyarchaeota archaeon]